jgi:hypothetical protein
MGDSFFKMVEAIAGLIVTVAIISVVVSKKAQTPAVLQAAASGFGNSLAVAEAPVTGANTPINLSYPSSSPWDSSPYMGG